MAKELLYEVALPVPPVPLATPVQRTRQRKPLRCVPMRDMQDGFYWVAARQCHRHGHWLGGLRV